MSYRINSRFLLYDSDKPSKRYVIVNEDGKKIYFGSPLYDNYTIHKDFERKERYIARHMRREDWKNIETAGFWALFLLWNKPTLTASIKDVQERFHIKIIKKRNVYPGNN